MFCQCPQKSKETELATAAGNNELQQAEGEDATVEPEPEAAPEREPEPEPSEAAKMASKVEEPQPWLEYHAVLSVAGGEDYWTCSDLQLDLLPLPEPERQKEIDAWIAKQDPEQEPEEPEDWIRFVAGKRKELKSKRTEMMKEASAAAAGKDWFGSRARKEKKAAQLMADAKELTSFEASMRKRKRLMLDPVHLSEQLDNVRQPNSEEFEPWTTIECVKTCSSLLFLAPRERTSSNSVPVSAQREREGR